MNALCLKPAAARLAMRLLAAMLAVPALLLAPRAAHADTGLVLNGGLRSGGGFESADGARQGLALRSGGAWALAFEWPYDDHRLWQVWLGRQSTRLALGAATSGGAAGTASEMPLALTTLQLGGVNYFDGPVGRGPYVAGGLGFTHMDPNLAGTSARTRASMSIALGYEGPLAKSLSWRAELRGHLTLLNSEGGLFCSGGCTVFIRGDSLTQAEALVGLRIAF